ncbi:RNA 2',3'-cyclic phosphodiesterase [Pontibacter beigongshangensis]|uniref:RNA 2',3'-cyclic phosphodiesterase n=1 Tax=Pontibacter beigongshangensis TaxID=2574733 RepID=UPI001650617C|nr:RNA 2',3'-cyclic phosphodiesterase [Pontibacter beigongshangensis]
MKNTIRLFVAAALPADLKEYLARESQPFRHESVRFVPEENLHLTLFFIGQVPHESLPDIQDRIRRTAMHHAPFVLQLQCLEPGPKPRSPRLVWARFEQHPLFEQLSKELTQQLAPQPPGQQKTIPHVTLARLRKDMPAPQALPTILPAAPVQLAVSAVSLWQSELASPHPRYSILQSFALS